MYPMPEAAGFSILESLLRSDAAAVAVAAFDRREWQRVYGRWSPILDRMEQAAPLVSTANRWRSAVRSAPPEQRVHAMEEYLTLELGARARTADPITLDEPTANYAIDSLAMLEVRSHISDDLGVLVPPSLFLDNPTIRLLARALAARMTAREAAAAEHARLADTLQQIDRLSDDEIEATLAR
jgi:acyl carrier protein